MYNGINGGIGRARGHYDPLNSVLAGGLTGAIFKSTGKGAVVQTFSQGSNATPGIGQLKHILLTRCALFSWNDSWTTRCWLSRRGVRSGSRHLGLWQGSLELVNIILSSLENKGLGPCHVYDLAFFLRLFECRINFSFLLLHHSKLRNTTASQ